MRVDLILVGRKDETNIGGSFFKAARELGLKCFFLNHGDAQSSLKWARAFKWRFFDRKPVYFKAFGEKVLEACLELRPSMLLTTGISPVGSEVLKKIGEIGVRCVNYLTDDPWNPAHHNIWFIKALRCYDSVFSVRYAGIDDIKKTGCNNVYYLPFGYDPDIFFSEPLSDEPESEVLFVGGADADRLPYISALIKANIQTRLCGSYWDRFPETNKITLGQLPAHRVRRLTAKAKISLCLVRRANRDDNCMRTFEIAATGSCMLAEDTLQHRKIFGREGEAVLYFLTVEEMIKKAQYLLMSSDERFRLKESAKKIVSLGGHTYKDRLAEIISVGD